MSHKRTNSNETVPVLTESEKSIFAFLISVSFAVVMNFFVVELSTLANTRLIFVISILVCFVTITMWRILQIPFITISYGIIWIDTSIIYILSRIIEGYSAPTLHVITLGSLFLITVSTFVLAILIFITGTDKIK